MEKKTKKRIALALLASSSLTLFSVRANADLFGIPGVPSIVWDPSTMAQVVQDVAAVMKLYAVQQEALQAYRNSQAFFSGGYKYAWRGMLMSSVDQGVSGMNAQGSAWGRLARTGADATGEWNSASLPYTLPNIMQSDMGTQANASSLKILDNAGTNALLVHDLATEQQKQMSASISKLQDAVASGDPKYNSQTEQLNLLTAGTAQTLQMQQAQVGTEMARLQLETAQAKITRDQMAERMQYQADVQAYQTHETSTVNSSSKAMFGWIPK